MGIKKALLRTIVISTLALTLACGGGGSFTDSRDRQVYRTVKIGKDTWMAENLNYKTDSSWCYGNADSNCVKYGRLYTWDAATTACPRGWRLPSRGDWGDLVYVLGDDDNAGEKLRSKTGWENDDNWKENYERYNENGNGTDTLGFAALGGGYRDYACGGFDKAGFSGHFWSATEHWGGKAYGRSMRNDAFGINEIGYGKMYGLSVRCVRGAGGASGGVAPTPAAAATDSFFTDTRDGKRYRTVGIVSQTWMAENLSFKTDSSYCYGGDDDSCAKYGRLYDFATAREVCPYGWHLPSEREWDRLIRAAWGKESAGKMLKSSAGWNVIDSVAKSGNGIDEFGFSALPSGNRHFENRRGGLAFAKVAGYGTCFWGSVMTVGFNNWTGCLSMDGGDSVRKKASDWMSDANPVRCVRDAHNVNAAEPPPTPMAAPKPRGRKSSFTDLRDGRSYKTVKIGTQTWMAENLNFGAEKSLCYNDYESNCTKYGRLYDWHTAKSVCPSGWHLPDTAEWKSLMEASSGVIDSVPSSVYHRNYRNAGKKLKSKAGWKTFSYYFDCYRSDNSKLVAFFYQIERLLMGRKREVEERWKSGNGTDRFGFSATPGGCRNCERCLDCWDCGFTDAGYYGFWWSATRRWYSQMMNHVDYGTLGSNTSSDASLSVRCVQDADGASADAKAPQPAIVDSPLVDFRNGQVYRTVKIGGITWMAENLNFKTGGTYCYENSDANCKTYGRLYTLEAATRACPAGWVLPSSREWDGLIETAGGIDMAGKALKSKIGWNERKNSTSGGGTDDFGFEALPGSARIYGKFGGIGDYRDNAGYSGLWWVNDDESTTDNSDATSWGMDYNRDNVSWSSIPKGSGLSVRCVKDI